MGLINRILIPGEGLWKIMQWEYILAVLTRNLTTVEPFLIHATCSTLFVEDCPVCIGSSARSACKMIAWVAGCLPRVILRSRLEVIKLYFICELPEYVWPQFQGRRQKTECFQFTFLLFPRSTLSMQTPVDLSELQKPWVYFRHRLATLTLCKKCLPRCLLKLFYLLHL